MRYVAKTYTSVYPYGLIARGEALEEKHIRALGEAGVADLLARGVIEAEDPLSGDDAPVLSGIGTSQGEEGSSFRTEGADTSPNEGRLEEDEDEDGEALEPDMMDDLVNESEEAPAPKPTPKENSGGRKAK